MTSWIIFSILALISWGVWGFMMKLSINSVGCAKSVMIFQSLGGALVVLLVLASMKFKLQGNINGFGLSMATGVFGVLGTLFFILAISSGRGAVSMVSPLTALYPLVTITLAVVLLGEPLTLKQGIGSVMALGAMILFAL